MKKQTFTIENLHPADAHVAGAAGAGLDPAERRVGARRRRHLACNFFTPKIHEYSNISQMAICISKIYAKMRKK